MKNRTVIGVICIILSVALMFGISPLVNNLSSNKITVCQVTENISKGELITSSDVTLVEIGSFGLTDGMLTSKDEIVGKYAKSDIYANVNIYPDMLTDKIDTSDDIFDSLDGEKIAMSITIQSLASGVSDNLKNGDIVSIVVVNGLESSIPTDLTYVKVITTTSSSGVDSDQISDDEKELSSTVTLLVTPEQAELLANYEANSKIHLTLVSRDEDKAEEFLLKQEELTAEKLEEESFDEEQDFLDKLEQDQNSEVTEDE